jgi:hypothetical protein
MAGSMAITTRARSGALSAFGFRLSRFIASVVGYRDVDTLVSTVTALLLPSVIYLVVTAALGFGLGCLVAVGVLQRAAKNPPTTPQQSN